MHTALLDQPPSRGVSRGVAAVAFAGAGLERAACWRVGQVGRLMFFFYVKILRQTGICHTVKKSKIPGKPSCQQNFVAKVYKP